MTARREVRVADSFFARLDEQLGAERGPGGEPSATDFIVIDPPAIVELFATTFDDLPEAIPGVPAVRMLIDTGALARAYVVQGIEITDGVVPRRIDAIGQNDAWGVRRRSWRRRTRR